VRFVDTNVLLYAISTVRSEGAKADRARALLAARDLRLSVQVLQEFYVQATQESREDALSHEEAHGLLVTFSRFPALSITTALMLAATETRRRFGISYWDAAIIEAARASGCDVVLSEDLDEGTDYEGVTVENPFRGL
jgi:predicted nucleic acid-binding protein